MKKIFFSLLAIGAIASCAKVEAVFTEGDSEIKLAPVAALQTKAEATNDANYHGAVDGINYPTSENFDVYAYWKNVPAGSTETDFSDFLKAENGGGVEFTNKGNYWGGILNYYWPKNGSLRFAAYSPSHLEVAHTLVDDLYTVSYTQPFETDKTWDFLVAPTSPSYSLMTATEKVAIEFQHALSWITLKVVAKDADAAKAFDIKKVTINGVKTTANFAAKMGDGIQFDEWSDWKNPKSYVVFDNAAEPQRVTMNPAVIETTAAGTLVIPQATTSVTIEFDQYGINGTADTPNMTVTLDLVLDKEDEQGRNIWEPGKHYNYNLVFGLDEILINPSVADWTEVEVGELEADNVYNVSNKAQLEAALVAVKDAAKDAKIVFQSDIAGSYNVPEIPASTLTIDGNGFKFDGTFEIVGNSSYDNSYTVFEDIKFETADAATFTKDAFIYCNEQNGNTRYPDNVSIRNCEFKATGSVEVVAAKFRNLNGVVAVDNTKAYGLHSFLQMLSSGKGEVKVCDVTIENCKNGISLETASATIRRSTIKTEAYGVRANGSVATTNIVESTIEAKQPVIVRKVTTDGYVLNLAENTVLTSTDVFQIIFTSGSDDKPYATPTGKFTVTGAEGYAIYPLTAATTKDEFEAILADEDANQIDLAVDLGYSTSEAISVGKNVTINAHNHVITAGGASSLTPSFAVQGDYDVVLNDAHVVGGFVGAYYGANVTVNGGSLKFTDGMSGRNCFYAASTTDQPALITINDVDVNMANASGNSYLCAHGNATIIVNGGNFYGKPAGSSNAYVKEAAASGYTGKVIIKGGTFNFDPSAYVPAGYQVVNNGSTWTVSAN